MAGLKNPDERQNKKIKEREGKTTKSDENQSETTGFHTFFFWPLEPLRGTRS